MKEFPPFRLDTANQCLWRVGEAGREERILLAPKAFAVINYLVDHAGRLVSPEELLKSVWPGSVVEPQAVKKHILSARSALGDRPKNSVFIETVPKRGYRFIAPVHERTAEPAFAKRISGDQLVGRARELNQLRADWVQAQTGERRIVFVTGETGIGKTALVEEFRRQVASSALPIRIARGQCVEGYGRKEAYGPMLDALGRLCRGPQAAPIVNILATQAPTWLAQFPALLTREHREILQHEILGATRERMLREFGDAIESITADHALLLVLEDLQWVDDPTVYLLSSLARRPTPAKLMLLGTCRPVDLEPPNRPLKSVMQDLLVHRLCQELALTPLNEAEVEEYVETETGVGAAPAGLAALLHRRSEGNPLFMVAALEHMTKQSLIVREKDGWVLKAPLGQIEVAVPDDLRRMIDAQLERLSASEQAALELASIVGVTFSARVVGVAGDDTDSQSLEDLYEELWRRHLIVRWTGTQPYPDGTESERYEFVHALYRQVLYDRQLPRRRAKLHRRIGERLETLYAQRLDEAVPEMAYHFEQAGDWPRAVEYLQREADIAQRRYALAQANLILQRALQLVSNLSEAEGAVQEVSVLERLATNYQVIVDPRAMDAYETLVIRAAHHGRIDVQVQALIQLSYCLSWVSAERSLKHLRSALELTARLDPPLRTQIRASCIFQRLWIGGWSVQDAQEFHALAETRKMSGAPALPGHLTDESYFQWGSANYRRAHRLALESVADPIEQVGRDPSFGRMQSQASAIGSLVFLGEWGEALREITLATAWIDKNGGYTAWFRLLEAWIRLHALDFTGVLRICQALPHLGAGAASSSAVTPFSYLTESRMAQIFSGAAAVALGDYERAMEYLQMARRDMEREKVSMDWYWRMPLAQGFTELALAKRDGVGAKLEAERFLEAALATAERTWQGLAWEANARVALANGELYRARDFMTKSLATVEGSEVPLAAWRVHSTAARIEDESGDESAARVHLEHSRATLWRLASSLPAQEPLREIFLSAAVVAEILSR